MVLEHLFTSKRIEESPWLVAWMAFMFVAIAVSITRYVYQTESGLFIVTLVVIPAIPFFLHEIITQEKRQEDTCKKRSIFVCYNRLIRLYGYFFVGTVLGFAFCASLLPPDVSATMFAAQKTEIEKFSTYSAKATAFQGDFFGIFSHNLQVLILMLVFSFIYSIGSIFLLVWNASLAGIFLENYIRASVPTYMRYGPLGYPTSFVVGSLNGILRLLPHGIFEISAFFIASIAGGLLSIALERRMLGKSNFGGIVMDVAKLTVMSVILLALGAYIESSYS